MKSIVIACCVLCMVASSVAQDNVSVLMAVVDEGNLLPGEVTVMTHFEEMGFVVDVRTSSEVIEGDGDSYDLIFIHEAISSSTIADRLKYELTPIMSTEFYIADDMALADPVGQTGDDPELPLEEFIYVVDTTNTILQGYPLGGEVVVFTEPAKFGWAVITDSEAQSLATLSYDESRSILFTVEQGALDANGEEVVERRAFFFMFNDTEQFMTEEGWELFDRTVTWCLHQEATGVETQTSSQQPSAFDLSQNYPNPFNPSTTIQYDVARTGKVELVVYDVLGTRVATLVNETQQAGQYQITFDASKLASGIYFYKLVTGERTFTKKMSLIR